MKVKTTLVNNLKIKYWSAGKRNKSAPLIFLHGWSKEISKSKYQKLINLLAKKYRVFYLDFPGFGNSAPPPKPWTVGDYTEFVSSFLKRLKIKKCILIGHSFGGRVAIKLANKYPNSVKKIILIDSAGVERKSFKVKTLITLAKLAPDFLKKSFSSFFGAKNFREASGVMKETLKLVVAENLEEEMKKMQKPALIVWGKDDQTTLLWQGKLIHQLINGSKFVVVNNANHGLPWQKPKTLAKEILKFLSPNQNKFGSGRAI
jgi:pimeloyl-ACP methyl ester carboxylesterase